MSGINYLSMSDEEIAKLDLSTVQPSAPPPEVEQPDPNPEALGTSTEQAVVTPPAETTPLETAPTQSPEAPKDQSQKAPDPKPQDPKNVPPSGSEQQNAVPENTETQIDPTELPAPVMMAEQKASAYDDLLKPFKANGKEMSVTSVEEARQLMQFGANYTKKMMQLKPHLKTVDILEKNGLNNPEVLNLIVDVFAKKDPKAIAKVVSDSKLDPMDIDVEVGKGYVANNHQVSDAEFNFQQTLRETLATDKGAALITDIETHWDAASHQRFFAEPQILKVMTEQYENGIYSQIMTEVERLRTLGQIPASANSFEAYQAVGTQLHQSNRLMVDGITTLQKEQMARQRMSNPVTPAPAPVRVAAIPKPKVVNNPAAAAAAAPRQAAQPARQPMNYLRMSDEEFLAAEAMMKRN